MSVPWTPREKPQYGVIGGLVADVAGALYRVFAPQVARFAFLIFVAVVVGMVVIAWVHSLVFLYVDSVMAGTQNVAEVTTILGGPLTVGELQSALQEGLVPPAAAYLLWPLQFRVVRDLFLLIGLIVFISLIPLFGIWWERKVSARIQSRMGPMRVGGWHGWSQSLADGVKLIGKEDLIPDDADRPMFRLAPYLAFVPALAAFLALPFGAAWVFRDLDVALIFILSMLGIEVVG